MVTLLFANTCDTAPLITAFLGTAAKVVAQWTVRSFLPESLVPFTTAPPSPIIYPGCFNWLVPTHLPARLLREPVPDLSE